MLFDFEGRLYDTPTIESAMSWRERSLLSFFVHLALAALLFIVPRLEFVQAAEQRRLERVAELAQAQEQQLQQPNQSLEMPPELALPAVPEEDQMFVFVQPRIDTPAAAAPSRGDLSDVDRVSQSPELADDPINNLPNAEGNSLEFVIAEDISDLESEPPAGAPADTAVLEPNGSEALEAVDGGEEALDGAEEAVDGAEEVAEGEVEVDDPRASDDPVEAALEEDGGEIDDGPAGEPFTADPPGSEDALRNPFLPEREPAERETDGEGEGPPRRDTPSVRERTESLLRKAMDTDPRLTQSRSFHNFGGRANNTGPDIQFDTKGVEFGPWIRRFVAQIYRNWFVPYAAMTMSGHVVLTFNVHKDGALTDLTVQRPSTVDAFTNSAFNAMRGSDPTFPLPEEYPDDQAFFTVTFYFNDRPPGR